MIQFDEGKIFVERGEDVELHVETDDGVFHIFTLDEDGLEMLIQELIQARDKS
jgi:hypothetical protein